MSYFSDRTCPKQGCKRPKEEGKTYCWPCYFFVELEKKREDLEPYDLAILKQYEAEYAKAFPPEDEIARLGTVYAKARLEVVRAEKARDAAQAAWNEASKAWQKAHEDLNAAVERVT